MEEGNYYINSTQFRNINILWENVWLLDDRKMITDQATHQQSQMEEIFLKYMFFEQIVDIAGQTNSW